MLMLPDGQSDEAWECLRKAVQVRTPAEDRTQSAFMVSAFKGLIFEVILLLVTIFCMWNALNLIRITNVKSMQRYSGEHKSKLKCFVIFCLLTFWRRIFFFFKF